MDRDFTIFPDDENGDVLWGIHQRGRDLSKMREVDFAHIFSTEDDSLQFAIHVLRNGHKASFSTYENQDFPWQVIAHISIEPSHANITRFESLLGTDAAIWGGKSDGWGFVSS